MSMVYSVMVYLEQHFGKFWDFIVVVVHEMIEFNPLPFKTDSIDSVAKGAHHLKHAIYACTWKDYILQAFCVQTYQNPRERVKGWSNIESNAIET